MIAAGPPYAAACAAVHEAAFPPHEAWSAAAFATLLAQPGVQALLDPAGRGMILLRQAADEAEILTLATRPDARRRGVARQLLAAARSWAVAAGVIRIFLEVSERNAAARALYAASGFVPVGRRPAYYADGSDAVVLQLSLAG